MPRQARLLLDNALYHILSRGNRKQIVFTEAKDFNVYLKKLSLYKKKFNFKLYGFCLMPNHVHLIGEIAQKENLAKFMHNLNSSYALYFNNKYQKSGHLWQDRFKSKIIIKDKYLLNCINYIELNPIRANITQDPCGYQWSSYVERNLKLTCKEQLLDQLSL